MYMLDAKWPSIEKVTGVDLSPFKLAICERKKSELPADRAEKYEVFHAPAEASPVAAATQDLVSLCLVAHESPEWVSKSIFQEAYRILRPGGFFTMLDLDKEVRGGNWHRTSCHCQSAISALYSCLSPSFSHFLPQSPLPSTPFFISSRQNLENLLENPFVAAIYKQTEPYMGEFLKLSPKDSLEAIGFKVRLPSCRNDCVTSDSL